MSPLLPFLHSSPSPQPKKPQPPRGVASLTGWPTGPDGEPWKWGLGQHLALIGDTGTGKTTLVQWLMASRRYTVSFRSKPDDVIWEGYHKAQHIRPAIDSPFRPRILLAPKYEDQPYEFALALDLTFKQGAHTVFVDDTMHVQGLDRIVENLLKRSMIMARSLHETMICAMQRPVDATRYAISQSRITLSFMAEGRDVKTIAESTSPLMGEAVEQLGEHDLAMFDRRTRAVWVGFLELEDGPPHLVGREVGGRRPAAIR